MCINRRFVFNRHINRKIFVPCGKCPACLQEKANNRAKRIDATFSEDTECLFLNFHYSNETVPYVKLSEIKRLKEGFNYINVYRDYIPSLERVYEYDKVPKIRGNGYKLVHRKDLNGKNKFHYDRVLYPNKYCGCIARIHKDELNNYIDNVDKFNLPFIRQNVNRSDKFEKYVDDKIAVIWYPDFQKLVKRVRSYLNRIGYEKKFKYFTCFELGSKHKRCHGHATVFVPKGDSELFKQVFALCWTMCTFSHNRDAFKDAYGGISRYISSYINCLSFTPFLFHGTVFRPQWHYSHDFGMAEKDFLFSSILKFFDRRDFRRNYSVVRNGTVTQLSVPLPYYVLNRYFPKFKGYCKLTKLQFTDFVTNIFRDKGDGVDFYGFTQKFYPFLNYTWDDCYRVITCVRNKYKKLSFDVVLSLRDFIKMYYDSWTIRSSNLLSMFHEYMIKPEESYDNIKDYVGNYSGFIDCLNIVKLDPNTFDLNLQRHNYLYDLFDKRYKHGYLFDSVHNYNN